MCAVFHFCLCIFIFITLFIIVRVLYLTKKKKKKKEIQAIVYCEFTKKKKSNPMQFTFRSSNEKCFSIFNVHSKIFYQRRKTKKQNQTEMEHSDHWEQLQRHGSLHDTYLSEDPPHIRKMFLVSCLRSLLFADTIAARELELEEEQQQLQKQKRQQQQQQQQKRRKEDSENNNKNDDDQQQQHQETEGEEEEGSTRLSTNSANNQMSMTTTFHDNDNTKNPLTSGTLPQPFSSTNPNEGSTNFFWSIVGMLRRCESPDCETGEAKNALRVLGPHNVVLSWIARPRLSGGGAGGAVSTTVGPAQTTDDWSIAVMCDGCIQKSLSKMSNVGPPVKPETAESLSLERRRSAFLLVDVTSWPSWAGSVQYAPWLNIRWGIGHNSQNHASKTPGNGSQVGCNESTMTPASEVSSSHQSAAQTPSAASRQISNSTFNELILSNNTATIEHTFITAIKSAFEVGIAQGLFLLPGHRDSITMNLENLIFFGYGCAHREEPDIIRTSLRNPSVYPVLFHKILPNLRGLELWRNRSQTQAQIEASVKLRKEQEKKRKKLQEEQKKKQQKELKEQKEREKKGITASTPANENTLSKENSNNFSNNNNPTSDLGKPLEWVHCIESNLIPLRHPSLCHFSTHCESLQPMKVIRSSSPSGVAGDSPHKKEGDFTRHSSNSGAAVSTSSPTTGVGENNARGDEDGEDHGVSFTLLVDAEEKRFLKNLERIEAEQQQQQLHPTVTTTTTSAKLALASNSREKKDEVLLKHRRNYATSSAFVSLHLFCGGDVSIDAISAWHLLPPKYQVSNVVLELNRNDSDTGVVPRMLRSMQHQLVGLHLTDCQFSTWSDFFNDVLVLLPQLQSLKMMCCRCGLEDAVVQDINNNNGGSILNRYLQQQLGSGGAMMMNHRRTSSNAMLSPASTVAAHLPPPNSNHHHHSRTPSTSLLPPTTSPTSNHRRNHSSLQLLFPPGGGGGGGVVSGHHSRSQSGAFGTSHNNSSGPLMMMAHNNNNNNNSQNHSNVNSPLHPQKKHFGTLKNLTHVELRSVPVDSKVISRFFDYAPNINSFVFPPNAIRRQQMQQNGYTIDPQQINLLTERMFLQLMNNGSKLKTLEILAECPGELFNLSFWTPTSTSNNGSATVTPRSENSINNNSAAAVGAGNNGNNNNIQVPNLALSALSNSILPNIGISSRGAAGNHTDPSMNASGSINTNNMTANNLHLLQQQKHNFTLDFWSRFSSLKQLHCQGWLSRSMLLAVAHLPNVEFIDGASSLDLTRSDLFEACLIPAFRKEGRLFPSLRYLDVSFCHRLLAAGRTLNDPVIDEVAERQADERIATVIRETFPDRSVARRVLQQQRQKQKLLSEPVGGGSTLVDSNEIEALYGSPAVDNNNNNSKNNSGNNVFAGSGNHKANNHNHQEQKMKNKKQQRNKSKHKKRKQVVEDDDDDDEEQLTDENLGDTYIRGSVHSSEEDGGVVSSNTTSTTSDDETTTTDSTYDPNDDEYEVTNFNKRRSTTTTGGAADDEEDPLEDTLASPAARRRKMMMLMNGGGADANNQIDENDFMMFGSEVYDEDGNLCFPQEQPIDPYPNAPALRVLCQRGFRAVPKSLLNLEVELLTSCRNEEEDGHKMDVIDMRSIKMMDEERELVTYQFESCGVNYLLADPPAVDPADVINSTPSNNNNNNPKGVTHILQNNNMFLSGVTPQTRGAGTDRNTTPGGAGTATRPTPRQLAHQNNNQNNNNNNQTSLMMTPSKTPRNLHFASSSSPSTRVSGQRDDILGEDGRRRASDEGTNDHHNLENDGEGGAGGTDGEGKKNEKDEKKKCVIQ